jgi:hypothetical protein
MLQVLDLTYRILMGKQTYTPVEKDYVIADCGDLY